MTHQPNTPAGRKRKWAGPEQYEDVASKKLMMLPTDMALLWDKKLKVWVDAYAKDADLFAKVGIGGS